MPTSYTRLAALIPFFLPQITFNDRLFRNIACMSSVDSCTRWFACFEYFKSIHLCKLTQLVTQGCLVLFSRLLPLQFPQDKPVVTVYPPVGHHLVDSNNGTTITSPLITNVSICLGSRNVLEIWNVQENPRIKFR